MTATVRIFGYTGMIAAPVSVNNQKVENAIWLLRNPYLANETLTCDNGSADTSDAALFADTNIRLLKVEVQNGKRVRFEITPANQDLRVATSNSPVLYGEETIYFGTGWRISVIEDA